MGDVATVDLEALRDELREAGFSPRGSSQVLMLRDPYVDVHPDGWTSFAAFVPRSTSDMARFVMAATIIARHLAGDAARTEERG